MPEVTDGPTLVSVIIPAYNEEATIRAAIDGLLSGVGDFAVEIVVVDGRSGDATREIVSAMGRDDARIRLIDNPERVIPTGLNAGLVASRGEVIVRMDAHARPDPGYVAACLRVLRSSGAWNVGGMMRKEGMTPVAKAASAATTSPFGIGGGPRFHLLSNAMDVDGVWLGCWPRWVFERVGLYDPELVVDEDEELNQRILDAGGRIRFDPSISAGYLSRSSWSGLIRQYVLYGMYKIRAVQKRPSVFRPRHAVPAVFVAVVVLGTISAVAGPMGPALAGAGLIAWLVAAMWFARLIAPGFDTSAGRVVLAYACIHIGYGLGTWAGLVRFAPRWFINRRSTVPALPPRLHV